MVATSDSSTRTCLAVVLAAGEGTRMQSARPKVMHEIAGRSMLAHCVASIEAAGIDTVALVVGPGRDDVAAQAPRATAVVQSERRGTAHAVLAAETVIARGFDDVLVAFADTPLVRRKPSARCGPHCATAAPPSSCSVSRRAIPRGMAVF